jgi:succinate dehydrogenase / fumarate reductase cytochrome b subunit
MKFGELDNVDYEGVFANDLYSPVKVAFSSPFFVIFYVVSMVVIAFHLWHGFQSAFQTLGWNHGRSSKIIRFLGKVYAVVVPAGFAIIPIVFYLRYAS